VQALVIQPEPFFDSQRERLVAMTEHYRLPAIYHIREFPQVGGLMSYGPSPPGRLLSGWPAIRTSA
jgi:putative ABC transport system substrate-binding protein